MEYKYGIWNKSIQVSSQKFDVETLNRVFPKEVNDAAWSAQACQHIVSSIIGGIYLCLSKTCTPFFCYFPHKNILFGKIMNVGKRRKSSPVRLLNLDLSIIMILMIRFFRSYFVRTYLSFLATELTITEVGAAIR